MTIQLTDARYISGTLQAAGTQHTLSAELEAYLVQNQLATWVDGAPDAGGDTGVTTWTRNADGSVSLVGPDGPIRSLTNPQAPILLIGGDHPYNQWWGTDGSDGMAAWYNAHGIVPYLAINTVSGGGTTPGGSDQMSWSQVQQLIADGRVEVIGHGHRHYQDNTAPTSGINVRYNGAAATATFQVTGGNAVGVTAGGVHDFSFSLTGASYDTLSELAAAITAVGGGGNWVCTVAEELTGMERSDNLHSGSARSAKSTNVDWACAGGISIKYVGSTYNNVGVMRSSTSLYVHGDGVRLAAISLSATLTDIITALNAISGITAVLAGASTVPNYVRGTDLGTSLEDWTGMLWLSATPISLDAGLSSGYLRYRNNLKNKQIAADNGVVIDDFAQSGGSHYETCVSSAVWRMLRGDDVDSVYTLPASQMDYFVPHVALVHANYNTPGKITAIVDALADSPGHVACMLMHKALPDGTSGYSLPTNDLVYYDQTENNWNTVLQAIGDKISSGAILPSTFKQLAMMQRPKAPANWLFNPKFKNSGESLLQTSSYIIPGWAINMASNFSAASVTDGVLSLSPTSSSELTPIYQICKLPSGTWELEADIEVDGYTSGNGVLLYVGNYQSRVMNRYASGETLTGEMYVKGNTRARLTFDVEPPGVVLPEVRGLTGPFNLSSNTNIWLYIDGYGPIDNLNCASGAANPAAVTAKEAAAAINAAIAAAGWPAEYHTAASSINGRLVITCPRMARTHSSYVEIRAASTSSATATIFGGASQYHYGRSRLSGGDWRSGSVAIGVVVALANGATVRVSNMQLRNVCKSVR